MRRRYLVKKIGMKINDFQMMIDDGENIMSVKFLYKQRFR